jgi:hypothetical protein
MIELLEKLEEVLSIEVLVFGGEVFKTRVPFNELFSAQVRV